jgi:hypothetical protein
MYQIVAVATHSETREPYVVYQALYDDFRTYIRPYDMFISEVDHVKYPEVQQKYRFELVGSHAVVADHQAESASVVRDEPAMESAGAARCESATESVSVIETENSTSENDLVNPKFLDFLDADSYDRKYDIYASMVDELDDHLINQMAASIDEIIEDGPLHVRIESLRRSIKTKAKYELHRR